METTFHNVLITISANSPQEAYNKLCKLLRDVKVEYTTDTYSIHGSANSVHPPEPSAWDVEKSTSDLMGGGDDVGAGEGG
jgi:hypothetical protein